LARFAWAGENVNAVVISPDGRRMVGGSEDGAIKLWEFATGRELRTLADQSADKSDQARVMGVTFAPDGRTAAATFGGGEVRVYELATGTVRFRFAGHISAALRTVFSPDGSRLATTGGDRTLLVWDVTGSRLPSAPPPRDLGAAWADLMAEDAARGFAGARYLVDHPGEGVALLAEKVKPVAAADTKAVAALIAQLESPKFAEREKASKELAALGEAAAGPLRDADAKATSAELRQRLAPLVAALGEAKVTGERLRAVRAVEALERTGTAGARMLLATLAAGAPGATLTEDAKAALGRLR
jgi:hypothetical protein